jgi:NAD+ synthase (glutamine-hydrolysing)
VRIGLGQFNAVVGDLQANTEKMQQVYKEALSNNIDLLVFPELAVCGYPPEDLLLKKHFLDDNRAMLDKLAADCPDMAMIVGFAECHQGDNYNSAALLQNGKAQAIYRKALLPNYGVFDERRYFHCGTDPLVIKTDQLSVALTICEDIWNIEWLSAFLSAKGNIDLVVNISASPFYVGRTSKRQEIVARCAKRFNCAVAYCNLIGGQDELIFDGRRMIVEPGGQTVAMARAFNEDLLIAEITATGDGKLQVIATAEPPTQPGSDIEETYHALVLGTRDYTRKNGFSRTLLGLSGGIDSAVTAAIVVSALDADNVTGISMPSRFNSDQTKSDAEKIAKNLGMKFMTVPIESILEEFDRTLAAIEGWDSQGIAYENLQARIRGSILMSLSNQLGALVLTTGNKSETAVGYSTLYGDTAGGFAVIKDLPKTLVYQLARYINEKAGEDVIPQDVITRAPSAELKDDQKDSDSLPDYDVLDAILKGYVEQDLSARDLVDSGLDSELVGRVIRMVDRNEYKRRQSPPGIKITPKAFGRDRRLPITNHYSSLDNG